MDVTRENFFEIYPALREKIFSASIISFDEEMTGIQSADFNSRNKKSDGPDDRYNKMVPVASKYAIIQFGICLFHTVQKPDGSVDIEASPYNFYIFPESGQDIAMSTSAVDFLRKNGMDFGMWISKGLTYANTRDEEFFRKKFLEPHEKKDDANGSPPVPRGNAIVLTRQNDIDFLNRNVDKLKAFLADTNETEFLFENGNGFLKRALYEYMEINYPDLTVSRATDGRIRVVKMSEEEKAAHAKKLAEEAQENFNRAMGFRLVFKDIIESKKPIVGHNLMFDLMFMMRAFDAPLPADLASFKGRLHELFPDIYDTKWIASSGVLGTIYDDTALNDIYKKLVESYDNQPSSEGAAAADAPASDAAMVVTAPDGEVVESTVNPKKKLVTMAAGFENVFGEQGQFHNAGYDAFCTGAVFCRELLMAGGLDSLRPLANKKLFMMQSLYHMDLHPERPNGWIKVEGAILYVGSFPETVKTDAIISVFTLAGIPLNTLEVIWIDGSSTYVSVRGDASAEEVINKLAVPVGWEIISLEKYDARRREATEEPLGEKSVSAASSPGRNILRSSLDWLSRTVTAPFERVMAPLMGSRKRALEDPGNAVPAVPLKRSVSNQV